MRNIAIVEDEDQAATVLHRYIEKFAADTGQEFCIKRYRDAVQFLSDKKNKHAVVFMDIQMPHRNGMSAAIELRQFDKTVSIVFITNLIQYAQKGYEVDAVAYILKPVQYYDFALKFRKALDVYVMNEKQDLTLNTSEGPCRISTDKLVYLSHVEEELKQFGFLRCNQCYLVNPRFIVSVQGFTVQLGSARLTISRPRKKAFMAELANWYAGMEDRS